MSLYLLLNPSADNPTMFSLRLSPSYGPVQLLSYLFAALLSINFFVFLNSTQGFVLKDILNVEKDSLGTLSGSLVFWDQIVSLPAVYLWGLFSDVIGSYNVFALGFLIESVALFCYPRATSFSMLLGFRLLFAVGGSATASMLTAVLAHIAHEEDRGKLSGIVGLFAGCGALLAVFVFLPLPNKYSDSVVGLNATYLLASVTAITISFIMILSAAHRRWSNRSMATEPTALNTSPDSTSPIVSTEEVKKSKLIDSIRDGFYAAKNPKVFLGYAACFLARSDSMAITLFLPIWVYKYYLENDLCPSSNTFDDSDIKSSCRPAYTKSSVITGVAQTFALIGAPVFGFLFDRFNRLRVVMTASLMAGLGYFLVGLLKSPMSPVIYIYLFLIGVGEIGLIVTSLGLVTHSSVPAHARGSIAGFSSFFGALGVLVVSLLGGILFDIGMTGPFLLLGALHLAFLILNLIVSVIVSRSTNSESPTPP
ncbi:major facilitator superfamily domain-containing protein [Globomyces pollinis-pini]|nr:major facilitator superfamily domain-containing protein [Globomyces pollinis-pini]